MNIILSNSKTGADKGASNPQQYTDKVSCHSGPLLSMDNKIYTCMSFPNNQTYERNKPCVKTDQKKTKTKPKHPK